MMFETLIEEFSTSACSLVAVRIVPGTENYFGKEEFHMESLSESAPGIERRSENHDSH